MRYRAKAIVKKEEVTEENAEKTKASREDCRKLFEIQ